jgi:UDP-GlcNAc:undecaprenyl-phosphate GlcNAc-1-phosphate transferase
MIIFLIEYILAFTCAVMITPVIILIAKRLKIVDRPAVRKIHNKSTPITGGIAIFLATIIAVFLIKQMDYTIIRHFEAANGQIATILICAAFVFIVGLADDILNISSKARLLALIAASIVVSCSGVRIESFNIQNQFALNLGWMSWPVTVLWITGITVAINFIDGLDGLAAGIGAITAAIVAILAYNIDSLVILTIMIALLGGISGFLIFNFHPAKIFMGDCGSMFLGFILACCAVFCVSRSQSFVCLAAPSLALAVPVIDAFFTLIRRYLARRRILASDYGHIHHKMLDMGLRHRHIVIIMYAITVMAGGLGLFMMLTSDLAAIAIFACLIVLIILVFRIIGIGRLGNIISRWKANNEVNGKIDKNTDVFENAQIRLHKASNFIQWWEMLTEAAEKFGFSEMVLTLQDEESREKQIWQDTKAGAGRKLFCSGFSFSNRHLSKELSFTVELGLDECVEIVSHKLTLFCRLIDESSAAGLLTDELFKDISKAYPIEKEKLISIPVQISTGTSIHSKKSKDEEEILLLK